MNDETLYTTIACASHPAFYPLTIHDEYVAMIMSYLKSRRSITKKLPYDKNKKQE